ncbi:MAG: dihydrodipicolinate synthase family protein [Singulisphaera sp.]
MKRSPVRLIAAPYTPFTRGGELNLHVIDEQADLLANNEVAGAFVCGTTGESMSMTIDERRIVAERWIKAAAGRFKIFVHVGHTCQRDCIDLAEHAAASGAAATAAMGPCFAKPADAEMLADFCAPIAAAAPDLPFYYYHIPSMTGVSLPMANFMKVAGRQIPNLVGLKYSHDDLVDLAACVTLDDGRFEILFGKDEILLAALSLGVRGAVGSTYNFMSPLYQRVIHAFDAGDLPAARREQMRAVELVRVLLRFGPSFMAAGKAIMGRLGIDCGPVRSPLRPLSPEQASQLDEHLTRLGFDDYCAKTTARPIRSVARPTRAVGAN